MLSLNVINNATPEKIPNIIYVDVYSGYIIIPKIQRNNNTTKIKPTEKNIGDIVVLGTLLATLFFELS